MTANVAEAEDLAQESLVRALRQHAAYDPERAFRPWLLAIASNLCRDRLRSAWWRRMVNAEPLPEASDTDVEGAVLGKESDEQVRRALASLPALYREALSLYHLGDMSYREMETITGAAIPALKQRVRRGTAMLQKAMQRLYPHLVARRILSDDEPEA
jgi:RNA polymerase sigma-70 factor (ECF subfamily)